MIMLVSLPKRVGIVFPKGFFVANDVRVPQRGQNPNLVERVLLLLLVERHELNPLEGVLLVVTQSAHLVNRAVGTFTSLAYPACR